MPHLSIETYVTQYFWLVILLLGFYYLSVTKILPKIGEGIKARRKIIDLGSDNEASFNETSQSSSDLLITQALNAPRPKSQILNKNYKEIYNVSNEQYISNYKL